MPPAHHTPIGRVASRRGGVIRDRDSWHPHVEDSRQSVSATLVSTREKALERESPPHPMCVLSQARVRLTRCSVTHRRSPPSTAPSTALRCVTSLHTSRTHCASRRPCLHPHASHHARRADRRRGGDACCARAAQTGVTAGACGGGRVPRAVSARPQSPSLRVRRTRPAARDHAMPWMSTSSRSRLATAAQPSPAPLPPILPPHTRPSRAFACVARVVYVAAARLYCGRGAVGWP